MYLTPKSKEIINRLFVHVHDFNEYKNAFYFPTFPASSSFSSDPCLNHWKTTQCLPLPLLSHIFLIVQLFLNRTHPTFNRFSSISCKKKPQKTRKKPKQKTVQDNFFYAFKCKFLVISIFSQLTCSLSLKYFLHLTIRQHAFKILVLIIINFSLISRSNSIPK